MAKDFKFKGVFPALVTPFDEDGVNEDQYRALIDYVIKAGATGIVPCGTTGEFTSMRFEEKVEAIKIACDAAKGRVPVLAGTGAAYTNDAIKITHRAAEFGADAALVVSPYFLKPTNKEIFEHYEKIARACELPIFLYNIPQVTGVMLDWKLIDGLREVDGIIGMKDSSGNLVNLTTILVRRPEEFQVVIGHDEVALPAFATGCDGAILASANIFPDRYIKMQAQLAQGDLNEALIIQRSIQKTVRLIVNRGGGAIVKAALNMMGITVGAPRQPLLIGDVPSYDDIDEIRTCLEDLLLIKRGPVKFQKGDNILVAESYPKAHGMVPETITGLEFLHGEALCGGGQEVAHVDLVLGLRDGPLKTAVENAGKTVEGYHSSNIISGLEPLTIFAPTVTITHEKHKDMVYNVAQQAVVDAVNRTVTDHILPEELLKDIVIAANVFVHPNAVNPKRVHINNFRAVRFAIRRAIERREGISEVKLRKESARHPFAYRP
ncbi:MAG: 4-hydroxy-tetrahydrodipicolinate synthase [Candidatus Thorarchaeota archaeon]|nr:MAG: 4-hydroxy-tetrahydrodipicolinate synthase [Candidatus Thorarchaeota archaeon]